jgi:hypothetical protein
MEILKRLAFFMLAENAQVPTSGLSAARQKIRSGAGVAIGRTKTFELFFSLSTVTQEVVQLLAPGQME